MRCSKSCYLYDLELVDLFENIVIEQVYYTKQAKPKDKQAFFAAMYFQNHPAMTW